MSYVFDQVNLKDKGLLVHYTQWELWILVLWGSVGITAESKSLEKFAFSKFGDPQVTQSLTNVF